MSIDFLIDPMTCLCCGADRGDCACTPESETDAVECETGYHWRGWRCAQHGRFVEEN